VCQAGGVIGWRRRPEDGDSVPKPYNELFPRARIETPIELTMRMLAQTATQSFGVAVLLPLDPAARRKTGSPSSSVRPHPGLRLVEHPQVSAHLELAVLRPHLGLVDLAVLGVQNGAVLVAVPARGEPPDDDEADDGLVFVGAIALDAHLRLALRVVRLGEAD